jgi:hypothetical protein
LIKQSTFPQAHQEPSSSQVEGSANWGTGSFQIEGMDQNDALSLLMTRTHLNLEQLSVTGEY